MSNPPKAASYRNSTKLLILLPLRAIYFYSLHYETPCNRLAEIHCRVHFCIHGYDKCHSHGYKSDVFATSTSLSQYQKTSHCVRQSNIKTKPNIKSKKKICYGLWSQIFHLPLSSYHVLNFYSLTHTITRSVKKTGLFCSVQPYFVFLASF